MEGRDASVNRLGDDGSIGSDGVRPRRAVTPNNCPRGSGVKVVVERMRTACHRARRVRATTRTQRNGGWERLSARDRDCSGDVQSDRAEGVVAAKDDARRRDSASRPGPCPRRDRHEDRYDQPPTELCAVWSQRRAMRARRRQPVNQLVHRFIPAQL